MSRSRLLDKKGHRWKLRPALHSTEYNGVVRHVSQCADTSLLHIVFSRRRSNGVPTFVTSSLVRKKNGIHWVGPPAYLRPEGRHKIRIQLCSSSTAASSTREKEHFELAGGYVKAADKDGADILLGRHIRSPVFNLLTLDSGYWCSWRKIIAASTCCYC